jgi:hypothetical protein
MGSPGLDDSAFRSFTSLLADQSGTHLEGVFFTLLFTMSLAWRGDPVPLATLERVRLSVNFVTQACLAMPSIKKFSVTGKQNVYCEAA